MSIEPTMADAHAIVGPCGVIGVFTKPEDVAEKVLGVYPGVPFIRLRFRLKPDLPTDFVYTIPYDGTHAPAFVTNDEKEARRVVSLLSSVNLSFNDDPSYWRHPTNQIHENSRRILEEMRRGVDGGEKAAELKLFEASNRTIDRLIAENQQICILDDVVPEAIDEKEQTNVDVKEPANAVQTDDKKTPEPEIG
ncbi:MAG: hypothetical protein KGL39_01555 [Patescibacteria group bacterium]|nr:hypothetical protein [Patescibacteria group bacterium]